MSLLNRRTLIIFPLLLGACGFTPVYAPDGSGAALRGQIAFDAPRDGNTFILVRELEQRLGRDGSRFALSYDLDIGQEGLAITRTGDTTRFNLVGSVAYTMKDQSTGTVVAEGVENNFTAYSATGSTVDTLAAERDAYERLMVMLADQITARLLSHSDLAV